MCEVVWCVACLKVADVSSDEGHDLAPDSTLDRLPANSTLPRLTSLERDWRLKRLIAEQIG